MSSPEDTSRTAKPPLRLEADVKGTATDGSYWSASAPAPEFPGLSGDIQVDVAEIGSNAVPQDDNYRLQLRPNQGNPPVIVLAQAIRTTGSAFQQTRLFRPLFDRRLDPGLQRQPPAFTAEDALVPRVHRKPLRSWMGAWRNKSEAKPLGLGRLAAQEKL